MSFPIELDEGTAARRRVPIRLFASNGTSPDIGASDDTFFISKNGGAQASGGSVSAISAAAGMYYTELAVGGVDTLGSVMIYHDDGDFPQHVGTVSVVNSNLMSSQSNIPLVTTVTNVTNVTSAVTAHSTSTIAGVVNTATLIGALNDIDGSNVTLHAGTHTGAIIPQVSLVTLAPGTHTGAIIPQVSLVTLAPGLHNVSIGTVVSVNTVELLGTAAIVAASYAAGARDAAGQATDAENAMADAFLDRNMATGVDSGSSAVRTTRDALRSLRNRVESDSSQIYVYQEDDVTIKYTASINTVPSTTPHISGADPNA